MPGELKNIIIDQSIISYTGENRTIKIIGDPGARFVLTIKNAAGTSKLNSNISGYVPSLSHADIIMPSSGVYTFEQLFPAVSASDKYKIEIKKRFNTTFRSGFSDYILLTQWYPTTLTLTLASADNSGSYTSGGSDYGITNVTITSIVSNTIDSNTPDSTLSWEVTGASGGDITISRQPIETDFSNNIANEVGGSVSNTNILVKALANADGGKIKVSSDDADKLSSSMVVKESSKGVDIVKEIEKAAEEVKKEKEKEKVIVKEVAVKVKDYDTDKAAAKAGGYGSMAEYYAATSSSIDEKTELEAGETTVKEVTTSAVDTTNDFITLSTSQSVKYGDILEFTNGGTEVRFNSLKATQLADSVVKITAEVQLVSMGVQNITSTLALDNFITV